MWHLTAYLQILLSVWPCRRVIKTIYITLFSYCARMQFGNINVWGFVRSEGCHYLVQNAITTTTCLYEYIGFIFDPHIGSILMMHINIGWWKVIPGPRSSCPSRRWPRHGRGRGFPASAPWCSSPGSWCCEPSARSECTNSYIHCLAILLEQST